MKAATTEVSLDELFDAAKQYVMGLEVFMDIDEDDDPARFEEVLSSHVAAENRLLSLLLEGDADSGSTELDKWAHSHGYRVVDADAIAAVQAALATLRTVRWL